ncbi:phosphosulfolactate synthase [Paenibacillus sp. N4]|uniref:phosphosulfolactate synthase n=1 Tax=Paenibacillus vietnamensis TaxID=2590547 RepID=UPI001CD06258|nr:phosphosulfolactate synthase [Paenibacillus vietnamensis]MCA0758678.1 phosphosulfolactate synthase [Paenibacillus vietnamensis]
MKCSLSAVWPAELLNPSGLRKSSGPDNGYPAAKRSTERGQTMIIDKGLGRNAFMDLIESASDYIDCIKLGFGTAVLYPSELLLYKIGLAKKHGITIMPGGTLLEIAVQQNTAPAFLNAICSLGFSGMEVSDGTIELSRKQRTELIREGVNCGLRVVSEYGKKLSGSLIDAADLAVTAECDLEAGSELVTVEARESGVGVGIFDSQGNCRKDLLDAVMRFVPDSKRLMWEAPLKHQQVMLLEMLGADTHLGNIQPADAMSLEALRRGLRSDTFNFGLQVRQAEEFCYMI